MKKLHPLSCILAISLSLVLFGCSNPSNNEESHAKHNSSTENEQQDQQQTKNSATSTFKASVKVMGSDYDYTFYFYNDNTFKAVASAGNTTLSGTYSENVNSSAIENAKITIKPSKYDLGNGMVLNKGETMYETYLKNGVFAADDTTAEIMEKEGKTGLFYNGNFFQKQ